MKNRKKQLLRIKSLFSSLSQRKCKFAYYLADLDMWALTNTQLSDHGVFLPSWVIVHAVKIKDEELTKLMYDIFDWPEGTPLRIDTALFNQLLGLNNNVDIVNTNDDNELQCNGICYGVYGSSTESLERGTIRDYILTMIDSCDNNVASYVTSMYESFVDEVKGVNYLRIPLDEVKTKDGKPYFVDRGEFINAIIIDGMDMPSFKEYYKKDPPDEVLAHCVVTEGNQSIRVITTYDSKTIKSHSARGMLYIPLTL